MFLHPFFLLQKCYFLYQQSKYRVSANCLVHFYYTMTSGILLGARQNACFMVKEIEHGIKQCIYQTSGIG